MKIETLTRRNPRGGDGMGRDGTEPFFVPSLKVPNVPVWQIAPITYELWSDGNMIMMIS